MDDSAIFSATLGLCPPWHITSISFADEAQRMDIRVDFYQGTLFDCSVCGTPHPPSTVQYEIWFHDQFFRYRTYLHARVPRIDCCQGLVAVERPWCRAGSRFVQMPSPEPAAQDAQGQAPSRGEGAADNVTGSEDMLTTGTATGSGEGSKGRLLTLLGGRRKIKSWRKKDL